MGFDLLGPVYGSLWHWCKRVSQRYVEHGQLYPASDGLCRIHRVRYGDDFDGRMASPGGPTGTGAGGVAKTASAGQNGGGSIRLQHTTAICVAMATFAGTIAVL